MREHIQRPDASTLRRVCGAVGDVFWTVVALLSLWVGAAILLSGTHPTLLGLVFSLFLTGAGVGLFLLVWWDAR